MITLALLAAVVVLLHLHRRSVAQERDRWEARLDAQEYRHNAHFNKLLATLDKQRESADRQTTQLLAELKATRDQAADERVQLLNRVKPDTYQPPLTQPTVLMAPPAVSLDDDDAYWKARESRDEMVERIEREMQAARTG